MATHAIYQVVTRPARRYACSREKSGRASLACNLSKPHVGLVIYSLLMLLHALFIITWDQEAHANGLRKDHFCCV